MNEGLLEAPVEKPGLSLHLRAIVRCLAFDAVLEVAVAFRKLSQNFIITCGSKGMALLRRTMWPAAKR